jgi:AsmA protein
MSDLFARTPIAASSQARKQPRRRGGGRVLVLALLASAIGVGAYVALTGPVSPERLRAEIERAISRSTGRRFTIAGPIHVSLGLSPRITADAISLANIAGGSRPAMLTAASFSATLSLLPLLDGDIVIDEATVEQPDIILETAPDGTPNWQMHKPRRSLYEGAPEPSEPHGGGGQVEIHRIRVNGGTITYRPPAGTGLTGDITAKIDTLTIGAGDGASPMHGKLVGQANGVPITGTLQSGSFDRLQGGVVTALEGAWPLTIALQGPGASFKLDGGVNHPDEMRGYTFLITGNVQDLTPIYPWLPHAAQLPLHDVNFTSRVTDGPNGERRTSGLSLHAGASDLSAAVPGLVLKEAVFSAPGPGQQIQLNVDGIFQGAPLRLAGTATQPDTIGANIPVPVAITGQAASANLSVRGTVPANWTGQGTDLQLNLRAPNLSDLSPLARRPLPDVRDIVLDAHVGDAGFRLRGLALRDLSLTSSLGDLAGNVTAAWSPIPTLSGTLKSKHADLDGVMAAIDTWQQGDPAPAPPTPILPAPPPAPTDTAAQATPAPVLIIPDTKLPFGLLHDADADLTLSADRLTAGAETYRDLQAHLFAQGGKMILNPFRVVAPQGIMIGGLTLDASIDPPPVSLSLRAPSMSAGKLATALGYPGGASGQLQVDAKLSGTGDNPRALAASATGHLGLTMVNGQFTDALFQNAIGAALSTAGVPPITGSTDVRCLALRAQIENGQGRMEALALDTSRLSMTGTGEFDLGAETVALHLKPTLRIGGAGVAAPVSLTGSFGDLKAAADPAMEGGRFGLTIGGPAPDDGACVSQLSEARGGMSGPMPTPTTAASQPSGPRKKPIDLLRGLFH